MKKISIVFLWFLCLYWPASAQSVSFTSPADTLIKPSFIIKWAPLSLVDIDPTMQFGLEYSPNGKWSLQQELGYGRFDYSGIFTPNGKDYLNKEVWRSRSEIRLYLGKPRPVPSGAYMAFEVLYKRVNYASYELLGRDCENRNCDYKETVENKVLKDALGFHLKFGVQALIRQRIALDFYMGIGGRSVHVQATNKELEEYWKEEHQIMIANPSRPGNYGLFSGNLGFKVGYLLHR